MGFISVNLFLARDRESLFQFLYSFSNEQACERRYPRSLFCNFILELYF